jgi:ABC-type dipeptide/oligopeptide/nickel transport system ATPase subunit
MKRIRNIKQLNAEKKRLQQRQEEAEKKIRSIWQELKKLLHPEKMAKQAFGKWMDNKTKEQANGKTVLQSTLSYGAALLAKKFAEKAEEKLDELFKTREF